MNNLTKRERASMHLLKQLFDAYDCLPLKLRMELRHEGFAKKIDEIPSVLKMYKEDIGNEISKGVEVSRINKRFVSNEEQVL